MGLLDKFKNMFTEEIDDDDFDDEVEKKEKKEKNEKKEKVEKTVEVEKPVKPERTTRSSYSMNEDEFSIPSRTISKVEDEIKVKKYEPNEPIVKKEEPIVKKEEPVVKVEEKVVQKREDKFVFPVYFDDSDFEKIDKVSAPKKEKTVKEEPKKEEPVVKKEVYGSKIDKPEKKVFKPTPIISPIYGVIDKNYNQEYTSVKKNVHTEYRSSKPLTIDEVRNKAFGTGETETTTEKTLVEKASIFSEPVSDTEGSSKKKNYNSIDEFLNSSPEEYKAKHGDSEKTYSSFDDDMDQIENDIKKMKKTTKNSSKNLDDLFADDNLLNDYLNNTNDTTDNNDEDLTQSDLFNLIDSMYDKGDDK